jgi:hypothetical protein
VDKDWKGEIKKRNNMWDPRVGMNLEDTSAAESI